MFNKSMKLNNGVVIPQLALGTWLIDDDKVTDAVKSALQMGYRHIDTAQAYGNERGVGEGVRQSGIPRDEIFITSKVAAEHKSYESAAKSIDDTLALMKMDYLDMTIITVRNLGRKSINQKIVIKKKIKKFGVHLKMPLKQVN